jgi:hypothetical protein
MEVPGKSYMLTKILLFLQMGTDPDSRGRVRFESIFQLKQCRCINICIVKAVQILLAVVKPPYSTIQGTSVHEPRCAGTV